MNESYYPDINRAALIIKLKKPFIDWLVYTSKEYDKPEQELKPEHITTEGFDSKNVYLIPAYDNMDNYDKFMKKHYAKIFEQTLDEWYTDPKMWPKDRSWNVFKDWFDYEIHTIVFDTIPAKRIKYDE